MSNLVYILMAVLALWMLLSAICGYRLQWRRFGFVLIAGLGANLAWMILWLKANMREPEMYIALGSAAIYAFCAFGMGALAGRLVRQWRATAVDTGGV